MTFQVAFVARGCCETSIKGATSSVTDQPFVAGGEGMDENVKIFKSSKRKGGRGRGKKKSKHEWDVMTLKGKC